MENCVDSGVFAVTNWWNDNLFVSLCLDSGSFLVGNDWVWKNKFKTAEKVRLRKKKIRSSF